MNGRSLFFRVVCALLAAAVVSFVPGRAQAEQSAIDDRLEQLHDDALEAYSNMEMERAVDILEDAIALAHREGATGRLPAQLQITLGTVLVLGLNRLAEGRDRLAAARRESREVEPDPMMSTPLLNQLWTDVCEEVPAPDPNEVVGPIGNGEGGEEGDDDDDDEPLTFGQGRVIIMPVAEQLPAHAVPIYVEVQQVSSIDRVLLAFSAPDSRRFLSMEMDEYHEGYAARIPCGLVRPPRVEYFVQVLDEDGEVVASEGSEDEPMVVEIREDLEGREPSLPNDPPEPHCSEDDSAQPNLEPLPSSALDRLMYIEVGIGTGAGIPLSGDDERNGCDIDGDGQNDRFDMIQINPSIAWTELVLTPAVGFYLLPNLSLGIRGRLQFRGAVYERTPHSGGALLELRYFPVMHHLVRFFIGLGLGGGAVIHPITIEGSTNCGEMYYREARYFMGQINLGLLIDVHRAVALMAQLNITILAPEVAIQGDLTFGLSFTIPRR